MAIRQRVDPDQRGARATTSTARDVKELAASIVKTVIPIVQNSAAQITALLGNYLLKTDASNTYSPIGHKHAASDITSGGTTGTGFTVGGTLGVNGDINPTGAVNAGGQVSGTQAVFPTGVRSTGARNNQVATGYVAAYLDVNGNLGYAPSVRALKDGITAYATDLNKFLAVPIYSYYYKGDPNKTMHVGPLADDFDAAGLKEFVIYDANGVMQGLDDKSLLWGLASAYEQSRQSTLTRIANQRYQTTSQTMTTAIAVGGTKTYTVTWPVAFVDANYMVVPSVVNSAGIAVAGATAAVVPGSQTTTGCTVSVAAGVAILASQTLTVQAIHI